MKNMKKSLYTLLLAVLIAVSGGTHGLRAAEPDKMEVHFIDVGQGDSTLIKCGDQAMLIDAGDDSKGTAIQNYLQKQGIKKLDYLVLTHPDADHIGGAPVIITKFDIDRVFVSNYEKDNRTYEKLIQALDYKRLKYTTPEAGTEYSLGTASITILAPNKIYRNPNDSSIALIVQNGSNRFLFTGDAEEAAEKDIVEYNGDIEANVYQVGHHGSRTSTCEEFFQAVNPEYAVISCAEGNSYGNPSAQTLNTFRMNGVKVFRTDEEGTIVAVSDGTKITFDVPPSESWKPGEPTGSSSVQEAQKETKELSYVLNTKSKKFHKPTCGSLPTANREDSSESRSGLIAKGYSPCKICKP